jgi:hypothetical protein
MKNKSVFDVMICGPGDAKDDRELASRAVGTCSSLLDTAGKNVALVPSDWKSNPVIQRCDRAQKAINDQLVSRADALVAVFRGRLGSPTGVAASGTVEEIEGAIARSIPWRAYFYAGDLRVSDAGQWHKVDEYRKNLEEKKILTVEYTSPIELLLDLLPWLFTVFCSEDLIPNNPRQDELNNLLEVHDSLSRPKARQLAGVLYTIAGTETDALRALACAKPRTFVEFAHLFKWIVKVQTDAVLRAAIEAPFFDEDPTYTMWKKIPLVRSNKQSEPVSEGYVLFDNKEPKTVYVNEVLQPALDRLLKKLP